MVNVPNRFTQGLLNTGYQGRSPADEFYYGRNPTGMKNVCLLYTSPSPRD